MIKKYNGIIRACPGQITIEHMGRHGIAEFTLADLVLDRGRGVAMQALNNARG